MKGLASSILSHYHKENEAKKAKPEGECEAFGNLITEAMKKLNPTTCHIVQYHINSIVLQAEMGTLGQGPMRGTVPHRQNTSKIETLRNNDGNPERRRS